MLVIRLSRVGKRGQPSYRILVQDKLRDPWGKAFENVGFYNPRTTPKTITLNEASIKAWLAKGAKPSPTVQNLLIDAKIMTGEKAKATKKSKKGTQAAERAAAQSQANEKKAAA